MASLLESLARRLSESWRTREPPRRGHSYRCQCGRPVFFRNSQCLGCHTALGYEPERAEVLALTPGTEPDTLQLAGRPEGSEVYRRCENFNSSAGCNWLVPVGDPLNLCLACRLNRTIPSLDDPDNQRYWRAIENAKRRLVAQLLGLELPVEPKNEEDPDRGLAFDFLRASKDGPPVITSHAKGLITLNVEEADDAKREKIRHELREPYRTLLGHLRHEVGHYYWGRLVAGTKWHESFRSVFGDERADYGAALKANYENGPPPDWANRFISSYASTHPWEDWAETWAHYLHLLDGLETALRFGIVGDDVEMELEPFALQDLYEPQHPEGPQVLSFVNSWLELTTALNEVARSMGQPDFYPFVMSRLVLRKIHFIHLVVKDARAAAADAPPAQANAG